MGRLSLVVLAICFSLPSMAAEQWIVIHGGVNQYGLDGITDGGTTYRGMDLEDGSLDSGSSFGVGAEVGVGEVWTLGLAYERLAASTTGVRDTDGILGEADLPLHLFKITGSWRAFSRGRLAVRLDSGFGLGRIGGEVRTTSGPYSLDGDLDGVGLLLEAGASVGYEVIGRTSLFATAGLRSVNLDDVTVGGWTLERDQDGQKEALDFGGAFVRVGIRIGFVGGGTGRI